MNTVWGLLPLKCTIGSNRVTQGHIGSKAQMIHGTVSLVEVTFSLLEHKQIKASSLPLRQQTLSLKVPVVAMIKFTFTKTF